MGGRIIITGGTGFTFSFPDLKGALADILTKRL